MNMADKTEAAVKDIERKQGLRPGQRVHTWFVTQNNPAKNIPECMGKTPEEIVQWAIDHCLGKSRGVAACYERGENGTDHIHLALSFTGRNGGKTETVYRLFPKADIEVAKGSMEDIEDYLHKRGRFAGKGETVVEPVYGGEPLVTNPRQGGKDEKDDDPSKLSKRDLRWLELQKAVDEGKTWDDIWNDPVLSLYAKDFEWQLGHLLAARAARRPHKREVTVAWVMPAPSPSGGAIPVEVVESAVRDWLDECEASWGEWDPSLITQPHITPDTATVLVVAPRCDSTTVGMVYRLMSGSPMQVPQGRGHGFWAMWDKVVVVSSALPAQSMEPLISRRVSIPPDARTTLMRKLIADGNCLLDVSEVAEVFETTAEETLDKSSTAKLLGGAR
ncbi:hypothetical protein [Bifidobacterium tibiigranuli]|jgi:hypothetical protein|uniref:hypothetical protein n=1 Tax=Bifidobacterium tibiigranuli TaxID=2172043 RepID=UPI0026ECB48B|nr:hypothetical protein [Bifidobacterium tibiigranuli]MCI1649439.1 hypothetical protein [Bifidobacterium tibiigranuli]MCI2186199.1 hypothetical protein [Bifidobacterium tibiigranuli]MCI2203974.1 hypothetical protein [Bifidobacterium tibiigranuli]